MPVHHGPVAVQCFNPEHGTIALALHLPRKCLLAKDYLNHKYHAKRAAYLLHAAQHLHSAGLLAAQPHVTAFSGDVRRPDILLQPKDWRLAVQLTVIIPPDAFAAAKLAPDRNCLRSAAAASALKQQAQLANGNNGHAGTVLEGKCTGSTDGQAGQLLATPIYNAGILSDAFHAQHCEKLARMAAANPAFAPAAALLQAWVLGQTPASRHVKQMLDAVWSILAAVAKKGATVCSLHQCYSTCTPQHVACMRKEHAWFSHPCTEHST
jgi:Nrap protein domain 1